MSQLTASDGLAEDLNKVCRIAREAAALVMLYFGKKSEVRFKEGDPNNPVTDADEAVNALIISRLRSTFPGDAILAEESEPDPERFHNPRLWCVDPIDGTRDFVSRGNDFAVMIGLAIKGRATLGVVLAPTTKTLYAGIPGLCFSDREEKQGPKPLTVSSRTVNDDVRLVLSRRAQAGMTEAVANELGINHKIKLGSVGLKVAQIACGEAELYFSPSTKTHEWDACAPEAILHAAGGRMTNCEGEVLVYNQPDTRTRKGILASNGTLHQEACDAISRVAKARTSKYKGVLPPSK